jgi:hypothetical protein
MGLGSEIRKKSIPDSGVKKAPDPGPESATLWQSKRRFCKKKRPGTDSEQETWYSTVQVKLQKERRCIQDTNKTIDEQKHLKKYGKGELNCSWQPNLKETFVSKN